MKFFLLSNVSIRYLCQLQVDGKGKSRTRAKLAHTAGGAYPGFCSMKPTRYHCYSIATPPGWDASPSQVTSSILSPVPIYTPE